MAIELGGVQFEALEPTGTTSMYGTARWRLTVNGKRREIDARTLTCQKQLRAWLIRTQAHAILEPISASEFSAGVLFLKNEYEEKMKA